MAKKAKWLEEGTDLELLTTIGEVLEGEMDKKDLTKAKKAVEELIERQPAEVQGVSVEEAIEALSGTFEKGLSQIKVAYQAELEAMDEDTPEDPEEEDEAEDEAEDGEEVSEYESMTNKELKAACKAKGIKGIKGLKKDDLIALLMDEEDEQEDEVEESEDDLPAYEDMTSKELKAECKERGIKTTKEMKKPDYIKALEADDEE